MRIILLFSFVLFTSILSFAQQSKSEVVHGKKVHKRNCQTQMHNEALYHDHPEFKKYVENHGEDELKAYQKSKSNAKLLSGDPIITIPVVIHVLHSGETVGSGSNLSTSQLESQIDVLNEDFRRKNADTVNTPIGFQAVAGDARIEFQLATQDPSGNPTTGIIRHQTSSAPFSPTLERMKSSATGGADAWDRDYYLNIWVCDLGSSGVQGFAQFPGGPASTDGVVVDYRYMGRGGATTFPYDEGRPGTHEVGHWLNLRHTWGDGNCSSDDGIDDTPNCDDEFYASAPLCNNPGQQCAGAGDRMIQNYMDYSDDGCMNMFTQGQVDRMRAALNGSRLSLQSSNGLAPITSKPFTNFTADNVEIIKGETVTFSSLAAGATSLQWSFEGGSITTSMDENPQVTYNSVGTFDVTLTATNSNGDSILTKVDFITVTETPNCYEYDDNFNNGDLTLWTSNQGYAGGHNDFSDQAKAEFFALPNQFDQITATKFYFGDANATNANAKITCRIWDGSTGIPTTVLATKEVLISDIETDVDNSDTTVVTWNTPVTVTDDFFIGFEMDYIGSITDNLVGLYLNDDGQTSPATAWEKTSGGTWLAFDNAASWDLQVSLAIFPIMKQSGLTSVSTATGNKILLYPNPAQSIFHLRSESETIQEVVIYDVAGNIVLQELTNTTTYSASTSTLTNGVYFVQINTDAATYYQKLVISQ